jgi:hypothetical protein
MLVEASIRGDQDTALNGGLGDEQTIERIAVGAITGASKAVAWMAVTGMGSNSRR